MTTPILSALGRSAPLADTSALYLNAREDQVYDSETLRSLADDLEKCHSFQTAAIVRCMADEINPK